MRLLALAICLFFLSGYIVRIGEPPTLTARFIKAFAWSTMQDSSPTYSLVIDYTAGFAQGLGHTVDILYVSQGSPHLIRFSGEQYSEYGKGQRLLLTAPWADRLWVVAVSQEENSLSLYEWKRPVKTDYEPPFSLLFSLRLPDSACGWWGCVTADVARDDSGNEYLVLAGEHSALLWVSIEDKNLWKISLNQPSVHIYDAATKESVQLRTNRYSTECGYSDFGSLLYYYVESGFFVYRWWHSLSEGALRNPELLACLSWPPSALRFPGLADKWRWCEHGVLALPEERYVPMDLGATGAIYTYESGFLKRFSQSAPPGDRGSCIYTSDPAGSASFYFIPLHDEKGKQLLPADFTLTRGAPTDQDSDGILAVTLDEASDGLVAIKVYHYPDIIKAIADEELHLRPFGDRYGPYHFYQPLRCQKVTSIFLSNDLTKIVGTTESSCDESSNG